ncbi:MAG: cytochrome c [Pseudomonadota bacterium]
MKISIVCFIMLTVALAGCSTEPTVSGAVLAEEKGCVACHGTNGQATAAIYPNLNLQWERYLRVQLLRYKSGERSNAIMNGFASTLTDEQIRALAEHYGR